MPTAPNRHALFYLAPDWLRDYAWEAAALCLVLYRTLKDHPGPLLPRRPIEAALRHWAAYNNCTPLPGLDPIWGGHLARGFVEGSYEED